MPRCSCSGTSVGNYSWRRCRCTRSGNSRKTNPFYAANTPLPTRSFRSASHKSTEETMSGPARAHPYRRLHDGQQSTAGFTTFDEASFRRPRSRCWGHQRQAESHRPKRACKNPFRQKYVSTSDDECCPAEDVGVERSRGIHRTARDRAAWTDSA